MKKAFCLIIAFLAFLMMRGQEMHWTSVDEGLYSSSTTIIAVVMIDGVEHYSDQMEVAVFCGSECRGTAMTDEFFLTHRYLAQVNVFGENGQELTFKAYDHASHRELEMDPVVSIEFTENGSGTPMVPLELDFTFSEPSMVMHWTPVDEGLYSSSTTVIAVVQIDGVEQTSDQIELAVFSGDECRGTAMTGEFPFTHRFLAQVNVYGENGHLLTFKAYDHRTQHELEMELEVNVLYSEDGSGTLFAPLELSFFDPNQPIVMHWTPVYEGLYSSSTTVIAVVQIDGVEQTSNQIEFAVFSGDECRGTALTGEFPFTHRFLAQVNVYGENGHTLTFKAYDHHKQLELEMEPAVTVTFTENGSGTLLAPLELNFASSTSISQATELVEGWNWWSTYIEQEDIDGLTVLENSLGANGVIIKYANQYVQNMSSGWMGSLEPLTNERGYKIQTSAECALTMRGPAASPANHPIEIQPEWNWIGYPVAYPQNVTAALDGFQPSANDIIKGQAGYATYIRGLGWIPEFTLEPGKGYLYHSNTTTNQTLVYSANRGVAPEEEADTRFWRPEVHAYADNLCLMAVVDINSEEQRTENLELGAFVGDECRGSARLMYVEPFDRYFAIMTVSGEDGDEIGLALLDSSRQTVSDAVSGSFVFTNNAIVGTFDNPHAVSFGTLTSVEESHTGILGMYPNPVDRNSAFNLLVPEDETVTELEVLDMRGDVVRHETGAFASRKVNGLPIAGVYLVRVVCESGNVYNNRLIVK